MLNIIKEATLEDIVNYIFVMDSLNFCFWPSNLWEYEDLAQAIKNLHKMDRYYLIPLTIYIL